MQEYVEACASHPTSARIRPLLDRIIPDAAVHARFVNTLARMEYVGVRKILKSRRAERLDLDGLQHILDEAVHALRLKKAAVALAEDGLEVRGLQVRTFSADDTLAGDAGEAYLQGLDRRAEEMLLDLPTDLPAAERAQANYLLTSAAVEVRAQVFYPVYDERLRTHAARFSVASIMKDEGRHLEEMRAGVAAAFGDWRQRLEPLLAAEEALFARFLDAVESTLAAAGGGRRAA
jgi:hypothetical protein